MFQLLFRWQPHRCDFTGTSSLSYRRHLAANILVLWLFQSLYARFGGVSWALDVVGMWQTPELGLGRPQSVVLSIWTSCGSVSFLLLWSNPLPQNNLEDVRVYVAYTSRSLPTIKESQGRKSNKKLKQHWNWRNSGCQRLMLSWLSCTALDHLPRNSAICNELGHSHQWTVQKILHKHAHRPVISREFLNWGFIGWI